MAVLPMGRADLIRFEALHQLLAGQPCIVHPFDQCRRVGETELVLPDWGIFISGSLPVSENRSTSTIGL